MAEEKRRVNAAIDKSLYENVMKLGYTISEAITLGFEKILEAHREDFEKVDTNTQEDTDPINSHEIEGYRLDIARYKENIKALNIEIARLKEALSNAPDPSELTEAKTRIEGLQMVLEERNKRIEEINSHYENISSFANYFKSNEPKLLNSPAAEKSKPWWKFW